MKMKLLIAIVDNEVTDDIIEAAREAGATGATIISSAHGEGLKVEKTFFGLDLSGQRDVVLFLVVAERARRILEAVEKGGRLLEDRNMGLALQIDIEDAVGLRGQLAAMADEIKDEV
ncbi:P-II family nitrogen regulator [Hwanghaeella sp.]|uniref:P-II family nitrogen regulator n=1 Tax=Hwanghaeella sp. TaxID=2605943 RepID=UPI003CCBF7AC